MTPPRIKLLHVCAWIRSTGGVETLLAEHARADPAHGFDAWQLALFDRGAKRAEGNYATQSFSWRNTPRGMRRAMIRSLAARPDSVVIWHNAWGLPWFGDVDGSSRRIVGLWDSETHFGPWLSSVGALLDGVVCLSPAAARAVVRLLPDLPPERLAVLPLPISAPAGLEVSRPPRREIVIGCAGRMVRTQKRWDRLVPFVAELKRLGVPFRLEVISDGPLLGWLKKRLGGDLAIQFLGWQDKTHYWRRLQTWDAAVYFSDHEGGPITLLEAMAAGVLPIYPAIGGSLGDDYVPRIDPRCLYPAGDPVAAAGALRDLFSLPSETVRDLRGRAQALAAPHRLAEYESAFVALVRRVADLPRISHAPRGDRRPQWTDRLPLGLVTRAFPAALWR